MTKQEAIENHRKMWLWIAKRILKEQKCGYISTIKNLYFLENNISKVENDCFCCEYGDCIECPINWGTISVDDGKLIRKCCYISLYGSFINNMSYRKAALIAYKISKLPEWKG